MRASWENRASRTVRTVAAPTVYRKRLGEVAGGWSGFIYYNASRIINPLRLQLITEVENYSVLHQADAIGTFIIYLYVCFITYERFKAFLIERYHRIFEDDSHAGSFNL